MPSPAAHKRHSLPAEWPPQQTQRRRVTGLGSATRGQPVCQPSGQRFSSVSATNTGQSVCVSRPCQVTEGPSSSGQRLMSSGRRDGGRRRPSGQDSRQRRSLTEALAGAVVAPRGTVPRQVETHAAPVPRGAGGPVRKPIGRHATAVFPAKQTPQAQSDAEMGEGEVTGLDRPMRWMDQWTVGAEWSEDYLTPHLLQPRYLIISFV